MTDLFEEVMKMKLNLEIEEINVIYDFLSNKGREEEKRQEEIEDKLIKNGWDFSDGEKMSNNLFKNLVYTYLYRNVYPKYKEEDWYEEFMDYEVDIIDKKLQNKFTNFSKDSREMKSQVRRFIKIKINEWLENNNYVQILSSNKGKSYRFDKETEVVDVNFENIRNEIIDKIEKEMIEDDI